MTSTKFSATKGSHKTPYVCKAPPKVPPIAVAYWMIPQGHTTTTRGKFFELFVKRIPPTQIVPQARYFGPSHARIIGPDQIYNYINEVEIWFTISGGKWTIRAEVSWDDGLIRNAYLPLYVFLGAH